jgi:hypothetical protein
MAVFAIAGVLAANIHTPFSSAEQPGRFLEGGNLEVTYTCDAADPATETLLDLVGLENFPQQVTILTPAVEPAPSPGDDFEMAFNWSFLLDQTIVAGAVSAGATDLQISSATLPMSATTGATGADVVGHPPSTNLVLGDGTQAVGYTVGPFTGTFNRTAAVDSPIEFTPGTVLNSVVVVPLGVTLNITCAPQQGAVMTLNDQTGVPPSTTTTTLPEVTTTEGTTATTAPGGGSGGVGGEELPRTGSSTLVLVVIALGLIDLGYLALTAAQPPRRRRVSSAH